MKAGAPVASKRSAPHRQPPVQVSSLINKIYEPSGSLYSFAGCGIKAFMDLGILPPEQRLPVKTCLSAGFWRVNAPVLALMFGGFGASLTLGWCAVHLHIGEALSNSLAALAGVVGLAAIPAAWLWWSYTVPKWRIWALQSVDDWPELEGQAIEAGLIWQRGSSFEKTEIKSPAERELERALLHTRNRS
jgi:hypothetical protein